MAKTTTPQDQAPQDQTLQGQVPQDQAPQGQAPQDQAPQEAPKVEKKVDYVCLNKCYAGDRIWIPGDVAEGYDFANNANFEAKK